MIFQRMGNTVFRAVKINYIDKVSIVNFEYIWHFILLMIMMMLLLLNSNK